MKRKNKDYYKQAAEWLEKQPQDGATLYLKNLILNYGNMGCDFLQEKMSFNEFCALAETDKWEIVMHVQHRCNPPPPFVPESRYSR